MIRLNRPNSARITSLNRVLRVSFQVKTRSLRGLSIGGTTPKMEMAQNRYTGTPNHSKHHGTYRFPIAFFLVEKNGFEFA